jgi:hypothetical protein
MFSPRGKGRSDHHLFLGFEPEPPCCVPHGSEALAACHGASVSRGRAAVVFDRRASHRRIQRERSRLDPGITLQFLNLDRRSRFRRPQFDVARAPVDHGAVDSIHWSMDQIYSFFRLNNNFKNWKINAFLQISPCLLK